MATGINSNVPPPPLLSRRLVGLSVFAVGGRAAEEEEGVLLLGMIPAVPPCAVLPWVDLGGVGIIDDRTVAEEREGRMGVGTEEADVAVLVDRFTGDRSWATRGEFNIFRCSCLGEGGSLREFQ